MVFSWLRQMTHNLEAVSSNPAISFGSMYGKKPVENSNLVFPVNGRLEFENKWLIQSSSIN
jgi:hypothetical protein